jgi:DNA-binding NarL/FixJ family response regulator
MHTEDCQLRVLVADRPGPARSALARMLSAIDGVTVIGAEGSGRDLGGTLRTLRPDVVVIGDRLLGEWPEQRDAGVRLIVAGDDADVCASLSRRTPPAPRAMHA